MKALIFSFFNSSNIGDCILSNCLFDIFSELFECEKVSYTLDPFEYTDLENIKVIKLNPGSSIKSRIISTINRIGLYRINEFYYWNKKYLNKEDENRVKQLIMDSDLVIIGGGNMIFDLYSGSLSAGRFHYFSNLCKRLNKPIFCSSIGIGPFANKNQYQKMILALKDADYISFRDSSSYNLYNKYGGKNGVISTDPAFYLSRNSNNVLKRFISLNIIDPSLFLKSDKQLQTIKLNYVNLLNELISQYNDVKVFVTDIRDFEFANSIKTNNSYSVDVVIANSKTKLLEIYEESRIVIGSRMHSMILATTQYVPIIGLSWQEKVSAFFSYMGLSRYCHNIDAFSTNDILEQINEILDGSSIQTEGYLKEKIALQKEILLSDSCKSLDLLRNG